MNTFYDVVISMPSDQQQQRQKNKETRWVEKQKKKGEWLNVLRHQQPQQRNNQQSTSAAISSMLSTLSRQKALDNINTEPYMCA